MIDFRQLRQLYSKNKQRKYSKILQEFPEPFVPIVTKKDAENKFINRYFVKKANEPSLIYETNKSTFETFSKNPFFVTVKLKWVVVGKKDSYLKAGTSIQFLGVADLNEREVSKADLTFGGLFNYIKDYLEFWVAEA